MSKSEINKSMSVQEIKDLIAASQKFAAEMTKGAELNAKNREIKSLQAALAARAGTRVGRTGPKYTEEQIARAISLRADGASWKHIGRVLGIRATAHLSKTVKPLIDDGRKGMRVVARASAAKTPAKKATKPAAKTSGAKRTVKRSTRKSSGSVSAVVVA